MIDPGSTRKRSYSLAEIILDRIASSLYEKCRLKTYSVPGFPDFAPLISELSDADQTSAGNGDSFKVTTLHPSGSLIIQEQFFQQFKGEETAAEFDKLVDEHNEKYNVNNLRLTEKQSPTKKPAEMMKVELVVPEDGKDPTQQTLASVPGVSCSQIVFF